MVAVHLPQVEPDPIWESKSIYYMERILELLSKGCVATAKKIFARYHHSIERLLPSEHYKQLCERITSPDNWSSEKEHQIRQLLKQAQSQNLYPDIHDFAFELLLHLDEPSADSSTQGVYLELQRILAVNAVHFIEPDEIEINTFINAKVEFVVENRRASRDSGSIIEGDPGFYLKDALEQSYRCFIKQAPHAAVGDPLSLKITNIPGLTINSKPSQEKIIYLEPRTEPGDLIEIEVMNESHTGNSFTFRHHSYDGFLWFKRRGVNKSIFNQKNIKPKDRILAKVLYTSDEVKRSHSGQITRLGIVKAVPVKRLN